MGWGGFKTDNPKVLKLRKPITLYDSVHFTEILEFCLLCAKLLKYTACKERRERNFASAKNVVEYYMAKEQKWKTSTYIEAYCPQCLCHYDIVLENQTVDVPVEEQPPRCVLCGEAPAQDDCLAPSLYGERYYTHDECWKHVVQSRIQKGFAEMDRLEERGLKKTKADQKRVDELCAKEDEIKLQCIQVAMLYRYGLSTRQIAVEVGTNQTFVQRVVAAIKSLSESQPKVV